MSLEEIEKFNPGPFSFDWLLDDNFVERIEEEINYFVHEEE